jgi:crossover junction endodeoxyribonuclease RusA
MEKMSVTLPYPHYISVNECWKKNRKRVYLNALVKVYRHEVHYLCFNKKKFGKDEVKIIIKMYPPDNRIRNIDNILKVVFDALEHAGVVDNDNQFTRMYLARQPKVKDGKLEITIKPLHNKKS